MQDIVIARPDPTTLVAEAAPLVAQAALVVVTNTSEHETALESIKSLRGFEKKLTDHFEPARKAFDTAKRELLLARDKLIEPITKARLVIDGTCVTYEREQKRLADLETKRLQEDARKREEARQIEDAVAADDAGDPGLAQEILDAPTPVPVVYVPPAVAKVSGMSTQERWSAEVTDKMALIRYVAQHPEWVNLLDANVVSLNRLAVAAKAELRIPGVRAVSTTHRVARGA